MMYDFWPLLLPVAAFSGWYVAQRSHRKKKLHASLLPRNYFLGLNFLINEEPDKAVDVFIKMLEIDSETVETHLALGNLFRRRGEVARAIRIHQNLIARPELDKQTRVQALLALGQDYLRAGVFDRAERLFLEVVETGEHVARSLRYLLDIYQQEKEWEKAITTAEKYGVLMGEKLSTNIAHYYCELALIAKSQNNFESMRRYLKQAFNADRNCVRASMLQGEVEFATGQYKAAIRAYKQVSFQDPDFIFETVTPLTACHMQIDAESELIDYMHHSLKEFPRVAVMLVIAEHLQKIEHPASAADFLAEQLRRHPSLRGLKRLIELHLLVAEDRAKANLHVLQDLITNALKTKPLYRCVHCGLTGRVLHWHCPGCKHWSTIKPILGVEGD